MKGKLSRILIGVLLVSIIIATYVIRLVDLQLIKGEDYVAKLQAKTVQTIEVEAARGEILDTNGKAIVINRMGYSIVFDYSYFPSYSKKAQRNEIILELTKLLSSNNEQWNDNLPLQIIGSAPVFLDESESQITQLKKDLELNTYATAQNCMDALVRKYELENYSINEQRTIAAVTYAMTSTGFSVKIPYPFAEDISDETVQKIKENSVFFQGVDVQVEPYREYIDGTLAPHVIGMVGAISADEYKALKETGYGMNDFIGKDGIEKAMENFLCGDKGEKAIIKDYNGLVTYDYIKEPVQGDTVILTLDADLQKVAQASLEETITDLSDKYESTGGSSGAPATAGAVVVTDIDTGAILAMASYPTYDISTYKENFSELNTDEGKPLWNRATRSGYQPGSTYKPAVALAALEEGIIDRYDTVKCYGRYTYYKDYQPKCMGSHGAISLVNAIAESCNIYFFEVGRLTGIDKLNYWEKKLGFGQTTGIEIPEISGILAGKEQRESQGKTWLPGDTIQACIGQSDNLMTPIQLSNYCATIANGGTRYETHLVKEIRSYDSSETVFVTEPKVACETGISQDNIDAVKAGMYKLTNGGYCTKYFTDLPVKVAAKTGTAQVPQGVENGIIISYAPASEPEIAISVVIEHGATGSNTATCAAKIYDYYFNKSPGEMLQEPNILLN